MLLPQVILLTGFGLWVAFFDLNSLFAIFIIPLGLIISLTISIFKKYRTAALQYALAFLITGLLFVPSIILTQKVRSYAFYLAGLRAEKVVVAVEKFQKENNVPPKNLQELLPKYLDEMPHGVPPLEIRVDNKNTSKWSLSADVGTGMLNWDEFIYNSDKDYSSFSGAAEKLGNWIYYHE